MSRRILCIAVATVASLLVVPTTGAAQTGSEVGGRLQATRKELEGQAQRLEQLMQSGAADGQQRSEARAQVAAMRARLTDGDFQVGDRIALAVERVSQQAERTGPTDPGSVEQQLCDTFTVGSGKELTLPVIGVVALRGVLRSELEQRLSREIAGFIREPVVHARPLIRLSVQGGVARPGYYSLPADAVLSDALMAAGGPAPEAKITKLRIERNGKPIWQGDLLRQAIAEGRTLDEMSLRAGDQFVIPRRGGGGGAEGSLRLFALILSIPVGIYTITRLAR
jgi:protein involved in polysaccharide export with SLBB domain